LGEAWISGLVLFAAPSSFFTVGSPFLQSAHRAAVRVRSTSSACQMPPSGFVWADDMQDEPAPWSSAPVDPEQLDVVNNADEVATVVRNRLESAAQAAIAERGHFALAIPGGSVMKMLAGTAPPWADKCTLAYVNHKAVPIEDAALSTHEKATKLFLAEGWSGANVLTLAGSADTAVEAERYAAQQLGTLPEAKLPRHSDACPSST